MSRIGEGGFGFAEQARAAAEQAQLEALRQVELARAEALAEEARAAVAAARQSQPEAMGRVLGEVMLMLPEARQAFAQRLAEEQGSRASLAATVAEAPQIVKRMVDEACPPGTEMRGRLGVALLERVGVAAKGLTVQALEGAVTRALGSLGPRGAGPAVAPERGDRLERAEPRRFGGNALEVRTPALPAGEATSAGGGPVPSVAPPAERLARPVVGREPGPGASAPDAFMRGERPSVVVQRPVSPALQDIRRPVTRDVAADLEALSAALDPSRSLATPASSATAMVAGARLGAVERPVGARLFGIAKMSWEGGAEALLGKKLASIQGSLQTLQGRTDAVRQVLVEADTRRALVQVGLQGAAEHLEGVSYRLGVAAELSRLQDDARQSLRGVVASRAALSGVGAEAEGAIQSLSGLNVHGLPRAIGEIREVVRQARIKEAELRTSYGQGTLLEQIDAGAGVLAEPASAFPDVSAGETEATAAEVEGPEVEGPGVLTEEDLKRIGSGLDPQKASPQTVWTEGMVNTVCDLGRQQGGVTDADGARHMELARMVLGQEGADLAGPGHELAAADLAVALKMAGVPLEKVDPNQLAAAARYVSSATTLSDQQDKLRKTLDNFQVLSSVGLPRLSRQQMVEELWTMAKVPGHALQKLSDSEVQKKFQEVAAALNGGPGPTQIKVGQHNLKLEVGENGQVLGSSCKKPGFFSKVWSGIKKVAPIVLTVASFIPVTAPFARAAQGVISIVQAIKSKSLLGVATAGAALLGAGAAIARGASQVVGTVERVANAAARSLQGVSSLRSGNVLGGLASIGSGLASGVGSFAGDVTKGLGKVADRLGQYSTKLSAVAAGTQAARSYEKAGKAVDEARRALSAAQASGDPRAVAAAQAQLQEAESQKRTSLFGAAAGAFEAASLWVGSKPNFPDQAKNPSVGVGLESRLQLASRALNVARDVSGQDYLSAAVSGLGVAANLDARSHPQGSILGDASRVAEANLGYYRSQSGLDAARSAVEDAEARVRIARASGDAAALEQAESALGQARRGLETATMGSIASGQSLVETAAAVRSDRAQRSALAEQQRLEQERARDPKYAEALGQAQASQAEGQFVHQLLGEWAGDASLPPEARDAAAAAAGRVVDAYARLEKARQEEADPATLVSLSAALDQASQAARILNDRIETGVLAAEAAPKGPGFAALRPQSDPFAVIEVQKGLTVWEVSMRTGIPVDRILEFNQANGNEFDPARMPVGMSILVPTGEGETRFAPKTEGEIRAMQRTAVAERRANEQIGQALGIPGITSDEVQKLKGLLATFESRNTTAAVAELDKLLGSGSARLQQFARDQIGKLEEDRLTSIQHLTSARITEVGAAVAEATETSLWSGLNPLTVARVWLGHDDNVRAIGSERQATLQDQQMGVAALQQIRRTTGVTLLELGKMSQSEIDDVLRKANPQLDPTRVAAMRGQVLRSLGNPDVAAVARGSFNFGSFSWEQGKAAADTEFAKGLLSPLTEGVTSAAASLGDGLRHLRAGSEAAKSSSSFFESFSGHFVSTGLDYVSTVSSFTDTVKYAQEYWTTQGGVTGWVGDKLAFAGGLVASPVTASAKLFDHRASDADRTGAMVEVGLMLATLGLSRAGVGSLAARALSRDAAALAQTKVGAAIGTVLSPAAQLAGRAASVGGRILVSPIDDLARKAGVFTLRQGTRAADALGTTAAGRSLQWVNQKALSPLASLTNRGAAAVNRSADMVGDYFHWANNFGHGRPMATGADILGDTGLRDIQAKHAAAKIYDEIRRSSDDVARIAKSSGLPEFQIQRVKDHVFFQSHQLDDGLRRLDPSPRIADAWKRLESGLRLDEDVALLTHELFESRFGGIFKVPQPVAHMAVERTAEKAALRAQVQAWKAGLPRIPTPLRDARDFFEVRHTGPNNYLISGGGTQIWADGIRVSDGYVLESKFLVRPGRSPFVSASKAPPFIRSKIVAEVESEFRRYAAVIADRSTPLIGLRVITNDAAAVPFFEGLLRRYGLKGHVVVRN